MATAAEAANVLEALQGHALLTSQIAFDRVGLCGPPELLHITILEILDSDVRIHSGFAEDGSCPGGPDSIDVGEGDFDPLVAGNVNAGDPCHGVSIEGGGTKASVDPEAEKTCAAGLLAAHR